MCNGLLLLPEHFPSHIALVFSKFGLRPEISPKSTAICNPFPTEERSKHSRLVSSANRLILIYLSNIEISLT